MWNCSITQILREINFGDSRSAQSGILALSEALNFNFQISVMNEHFERQAERNKKRSDEDYDEGKNFFFQKVS